ncbi:MAG TPA: hypothetical protein VGH73_17900 [Thermoanaerobaculia bacterium]|jgi:hypothetical protein
MGLTRERATWITLPAGTPSHPKRISVLVSPMVEGAGRVQLKDLPRFSAWPSFVKKLTFLLSIDGQPPVQVTPLKFQGMEWDESPWQAIFPASLDVDLLDLTAAAKSADDKIRVPIAPPTTAAAKVIKQRYAGAVVDTGQALSQHPETAARPNVTKAKALQKTGLDSSKASPTGRPIKSWSDYISRLAPLSKSSAAKNKSPELPGQIATLASTASIAPSTENEIDPIQRIQSFHARPALRIFPSLVRDERDVPDHPAFQASSGGELVTNSVTSTMILEPLPSASQTKSEDPLKREGPKPTSPDGDIHPDSLAAATLMMKTTGSDRIAGGGIGLTLRAGDQVSIYGRGPIWVLDTLIIQVQVTDAGAVLYARHLMPPDGKAHSFEFRLPPDPPAGFTVTLRSLEKEEVMVTGSGFKDQVLSGIGKIYRWQDKAWSSEPEDRQDFHSRVASLRAYPQLLRRLGLILDFELPEGLALLREGTLRIIPQGQDSDLCPTIAYEHSHAPDPWWLLPRSHQAGAGSASPYAAGFLQNRLGRSRFKIVQLDTDTAALKLATLDNAGAVNEIKEEFGPVQAVSLTLQGDPQNAKGLPTLRQHGIALCDTAIEEDTQEALQRAKTLTQRLCAATGLTDPSLLATPLHAEDLIQGFWVDVRRTDVANRDWRSLCERCGVYTWTDPSSGQEVRWTADDEGVLSPGADEAADPGATVSALRLSQALFRWDGWSLAAQRPGRAFEETGPNLSNVIDPPASTGVRAQFAAKSGSLERLRLGAKYSFRLRLVDLAGNGFSLDEANGLPFLANDLRRFNSSCFERPETIEAPTLVPCSMPGPGEGNDQWVVRSTETSTAAPRSWLLLPPIASPPFVELHGVLDSLSADDSWELLKRHDDLPPKWDTDHRGYDADWIARYAKPEAGLPYLPDPLAQAAVFRHESAGIPVASLPLGDGSSFRTGYPQRISQRIVRLSAGHEPAVRSTREGLELRLPPGRIAQVELSSCPPEEALPLLGLINWCNCADDPLCDEVKPSLSAPLQSADMAAIHGACCSGEVPLVTPSRTLKLVHAVERPLLPAGRKAPGFVDDRLFRFENPVLVQPLESEGADSGTRTGAGFQFDGKVWIDIPSTGKLDFRLRWKEPVDDPQSADFYEIDGSAPGFQVNVQLLPKDLTLFPAAPTSNRCGPAPCAPLEPFPFKGTVRFADGRHRRVQLQYDATSRFVDYYDRAQDETTERFRIPSDTVELHVPARIPPAAPGFYYAIPTFSFAHERKKHEVTTRRQGGLRLYFQRGWFSSGADEMLAVVFAQSSTASLPSPLDQLVSAWGEDPLWDSAGRRLPERPLLSDVSGVERAVPSLVTPLRYELPEDGTPPDPNQPPIDVELALATYTPRLDPAKNLLYVDVDLRVPSYFPFVRLGLARYQRYALAGRELSAIVPAVFCQLMPDVTVTATPRRRGCWEVSVVAPSGVSPNEGVPKRLFRAVKADHGDNPDRLRRGAWPLGAAVELAEIVPGDDGQARWSGVIKTGRMGCGQRLYVMEEHRWNHSGVPGNRLVGCIPLEFPFQL